MAELSHYGRRMILTDAPEITPSNVVEVLNKALPVYTSNRSDIQYLYNYYRGKQPIDDRVKEVRPEINNKVTVNRANEIVSFKTSYLLGEPIQYVSAGKDTTVVDKLNTLNGYMRMAGMPARDKELSDWLHICGVAYRLVLPNSESAKDDSLPPFTAYTLDPRLSFVIRYSGIGNKILAGVVVTPREDKGPVYSVYTDNALYTIDFGAQLLPSGEDFNTVKPMPTPLDLPCCPIIEYVHNPSRQGAFEIVLSQLDEINIVESNRVDAIEQFVQNITVFQNASIDSDAWDAVRAKGAVSIKSDEGTGDAKVYNVNADMQQDGPQKVIDDLYGSIIDICGMPATQNGRSSTSDTGSAVIMRDGWQQAEARAKATETLFKESDQTFLRIVLYVCKNVVNLDIPLSTIEEKFTRRNYADLLTKVQSLTTMLTSNKIAPKLAFENCGLFVDPEDAYAQSEAYAKQQEAKAAKQEAKAVQQQEAKAAQQAKAVTPVTDDTSGGDAQ